MRKALALLLLLVCIQTFAQSYPVTGIIISLPANPDANTANWGGGSSMLSITASSKLINGRVDGQVTESKILVFIKSGGSKICGAYTGSTAPSASFNSVAKSWSGANAVSLLGKDCVLPPGDYELSVQFFGAGAAGATPLSEEKSKAFSIRAAEPQGLPITGITISLPQNPDANTTRWQGGISMLAVTASAKMNNGKIDSRVPESKMLLTIKKAGAKICGIYTGSTAPSANFNSAVKTWVGNSAVSLLGNDCVLPPGDYELCVQFFGAGATGATPLSEEKCKTFSVRADEPQSYQAPQLTFPANGTVIEEKDIKQPITFRWTPVIPRPRDPVTYRLQVWQLTQGQNATQAMRTNQPIVTKDVDNLTQTIVTNLVNGPCDPPYLCEFVWTIQALNKEGKPLGSNNGFSEYFTLGFGPFGPPVSLPCVQTWTCPAISVYSLCANPSGIYAITTPTFTTSGVCLVSFRKYSVDGAAFTNYTGTSINVPLTPGQHTIVFRLTGFNNQDIRPSCSVTVTIFPREAASINRTEICWGQDATVSIPPLPAGYTVAWEYKDGSGPWTATTMTGTPANTNSIKPVCATGAGFVIRTYRPVITGTPAWSAACVEPISIKVWCPTVAGTISGAQNFCLTPPATQTLTLNYTGGTYTSIQWSGPGANGTGSSQTVTVGPNAGTYTYSATVTNGQCAPITSSVTITVEKPLFTTITSNKTSVCPNDDAVLTMTQWPQPAGTIVQWEYQVDGAGPWVQATGSVGGTQNTNNIGNLGPYPNPPVNFIRWRVVLSSGTGICLPFTSTPVQINIIQPPCCATIVASGINPKCPGTAINLTAQLPAGCNATNLTRKWFRDGVFTGVTTPTMSAIAPGNYTVVTYNQCDSCVSEPFAVIDCSNTLTISGECSRTKTDPPTSLCANLVSSGPPCSGTPVYTWSGPGIIGTNTGLCITVAPSQTTTYTVTVTGLGCSNLVASVTVKVCK